MIVSWSYTISDNYSGVELTVTSEEVESDEGVDAEGYQSTVSEDSESEGSVIRCRGCFED